MGDDNQGGSGVHAGWVYKDGKKTWYRKRDAGGDPGNGGLYESRGDAAETVNGDCVAGANVMPSHDYKKQQGGGTLKHDHEKKQTNTLDLSPQGAAQRQ